MHVLFLGLLAVLSLGAAPNQVSKEQWVKGMKTALPAALCKRGQFFRECFNVTQVECEETALSATRVCLENLKDEIPPVLKQPEDGVQWGTRVGSCAGGTYEITLADKKISSEKCNDASQWVPKGK